MKKVDISDSITNITSVAGNAGHMDAYEDKQFDLVFSNSVIEHVGDLEGQRQRTHEIMRVGKHMPICFSFCADSYTYLPKRKIYLVFCLTKSVYLI